MVETTHSTIVSLAHHRRSRMFRLALALLAAVPIAVGSVSADAAGLTAGTLSRAAGDKASSGSARAKAQAQRSKNNYGGRHAKSGTGVRSYSGRGNDTPSGGPGRL